MNPIVLLVMIVVSLAVVTLVVVDEAAAVVALVFSLLISFALIWFALYKSVRALNAEVSTS